MCIRDRLYTLIQINKYKEYSKGSTFLYNRRMNTQLAEKIRSAEQLTLSDKIKLIRDLSIPGILAVITETVMGFIDTAMVGALGEMCIRDRS